jgi:hypothetical protein
MESENYRTHLLTLLKESAKAYPKPIEENVIKLKGLTQDDLNQLVTNLLNILQGID